VRVAVVSAVFGRYDEPVFVEQTVPCEYVLVTDGECLVPSGWRHEMVDCAGMDARLVAKFPKCRPWDYVDADFYVWLDGSIEPRCDLVESMLDCLGDGDVGFYTHPERAGIRKEAWFSTKVGKYRDQPVEEQAASYVAAGHPDEWGLWAAGLFIVRDTPVVREFGQRWLDEVLKWSLQDQLSLPVVLRECGLWPRPLQGGLVSNPLFRIRRHRDGT